MRSTPTNESSASQPDDLEKFESACLEGNTATITSLLEDGADVNQIFGDGSSPSSPLMIASMNNRIKAVQLLLAHEADANQPASDGATALYLASQNGHDEVVRLLLEKGADPDKGVKDGTSPLMIASMNNYIEAVQLLLTHKADVNQSANNGATALYLASHNGHNKVVRLLLEKGANINKTFKDGTSPLLIACYYGHFEVAKLLLVKLTSQKKIVKRVLRFFKLSSSFSAKFSKELSIVCQKGHSKVLALLLQYGADVNHKVSDDGSTLLIVASWNGQAEVVELLLKKGADPEKETNDNMTALDLACEKDHHEIVSLLLEHNPSILEEKSGKLMFFACKGGCIQTVKLLIQHEAHVMRDDATPPYMHIACLKGHFDLVKFLLEQGMNPNLLTEESRTIIFIPPEKAFPRVIDFLRNTQKISGKTPLLLACEKGNTALASLLLEAGADPNMATRRGTTPLYNACSPGKENLKALLLENGAKVLQPLLEQNEISAMKEKFPRAIVTKEDIATNDTIPVTLLLSLTRVSIGKIKQARNELQRQQLLDFTKFLFKNVYVRIANTNLTEIFNILNLFLAGIRLTGESAQSVEDEEIKNSSKQMQSRLSLVSLKVACIITLASNSHVEIPENNGVFEACRPLYNRVHDEINHFDFWEPLREAQQTTPTPKAESPAQKL